MIKKQKRALRDFSESDLPRNRKELFFECFKTRWRTLLLCGLFTSLFVLPLIMIEAYREIIINSTSQNLNNVSNKESIEIYLNTVNNLFNLVSVISFVTLGIGCAGTSRIIKNLAFGQPIFFFSDYLEGIKLNGLNFIIVFGLLGLSNFSSLFIVNGMKNNDLLGLLSLLFLSIIIYPILLLVLSETMVYKSTIIECLKNGVIIYFRTLPITLSVAALVMLPSLIQFIPSYFIRILAFLGMVILALPFLMLIWFLYSCNLFDKYININLFPELVKKGLYKVDE